MKLLPTGETQHPILVRDLDGLFVFQREELLAWNLETKTRQNGEHDESPTKSGKSLASASEWLIDGTAKWLIGLVAGGGIEPPTLGL